MPETSKKGGESAKNDVKAPAIGSPTKSKPGAQEKTASKEAVKLPSITPTATSPVKKVTKNEPKPTSLPSGDGSKSRTPTSPSKPRTQPSKGSKAKLADAPATSEPPAALTGGSDIPQVHGTGDIRAEAGTTMTATPNIQCDGDVEAEFRATAEAETAAAQAAAEAEAEAARLRKERGNGTVKLIYEQYDEVFPIVDSSTTQANIDEVYCLSFVMPNCLVHLSYHPNSERFERENNGIFDSLVREDPRGTFHDLVKDQMYYVVVEQEEDQLKRDQEATKAKWAPAMANDKQSKLENDDGRGFETCSCIYGNPCVDEYGCKDWHSRFAVATANGWKGF